MAVIFEVKVIPNSGKRKFVLDKSGRLKCYLKSQPEKGKANDELMKFIARQLKIGKNMVTLVSGFKARLKKIKVDIDYSYDDLLPLLGVERQLRIN